MDVTSATPASLGIEANPSSSQGTFLIFPETGIQICLNDVTIDDVIVEEDGTDFIKRQWRRSSWCPLDEKKKEEKHEKQRMILSVAGKSQSLSSLEGEDDDSDEEENDEVSSCPSGLSPSEMRNLEPNSKTNQSSVCLTVSTRKDKSPDTSTGISGETQPAKRPRDGPSRRYEGGRRMSTGGEKLKATELKSGVFAKLGHHKQRKGSYDPNNDVTEEQQPTENELLSGSLRTSIKDCKINIPATKTSVQSSAGGHFQWRRVASKLGIDRTEERHKELDVNGLFQAFASQIHDDVTMTSPETLEDDPDAVYLDENPDVIIDDNEAEAWSVTVDKKTLKKMQARSIKKQDHIWELVQTEKRHYRTLLILQKVFASGLLSLVSINEEVVMNLFPCLCELLTLHRNFILSLVTAQRNSLDRSIENIGFILCSQFDGEMAGSMKHAYGMFCSKHGEALELYKNLLRTDANFQDFIKRCSRHNACRRMTIPECFLLVAQRISKYPLLIEPIIKTTPDNTVEKKLLIQCLITTRDILNHVDRKVDERQKEKRLFSIYNKMDARSTASYGGRPFKKSDVLSRKLIYEGHINWVSARGKFVEVLAVVLTDVVIFLSETNHKSSFISLDNKSGVVPLSNLLIREKGDTKDSKGLYLIHRSPNEPEMYEFVCKTADQRKQWIQMLKKAIEESSQEGTNRGSPVEGKLQEALQLKLKNIIEGMHNRDEMVEQYMTSKELLCSELLECIFKQDPSEMNPSRIRGEQEQTAGKIFQNISNDVSAVLGTLQSASCRADPSTCMTSQLCHQLMQLQRNVHHLMVLHTRQCTDFYRLLIEPDRKLSFRELMNSRCGMEDADDSAQRIYPEFPTMSNDGFRYDFIAKSVEEIRKKKQDLNNQLIEVEHMKSDLERERLEFYSMKEKFISSNQKLCNPSPQRGFDLTPFEDNSIPTLNPACNISSPKNNSKFDQFPTSASYHTDSYKSPLDHGLLRLGSEENFSAPIRDYQESKSSSRVQGKTFSQGQKKYDVLHGSLNDKMLFVQPKIQISDLKKKFFNEGIGISPRGRLSSENNEMETTQQSQVWRTTQSCSGSPGTLGGCSPHSLQGLMFLEFNQTDPGNVSECPPKNESLRSQVSAISRPFSGSVLSLNKTAEKGETPPTLLPKNEIIPNIFECNPCSSRNSMPHIHDQKAENKNNPSKGSEKTFQTVDFFDCSEAVDASIYKERSNILEQIAGGKSSFSDANNLPTTQRLKDSSSELSSKMNEFKMNFLARERKSVLNISLRRSDELPIFRSKKKDQSMRNKIQEGEKTFSGNKERLENFSDSETQEKKRPPSNSFCRVLAASIGSLASFYSTFSSSSSKTTSPKTRKIFKSTSVKPPLTTTMSATDVLSSNNRRCSSFFVSRSSKDRKGIFQSPVRQYVRNRSGTSNSSNDSITEVPTSAPVTFGANKNI